MAAPNTHPTDRHRTSLRPATVRPPLPVTRLPVHTANTSALPGVQLSRGVKLPADIVAASMSATLRTRGHVSRRMRGTK